MKTQSIFQGTIIVLLGGILFMLFALYRKIPEINILTQAELVKISELTDENVQKEQMENQSVFRINGYVDANVYNTVSVDVNE